MKATTRSSALFFAISAFAALSASAAGGNGSWNEGSSKAGEYLNLSVFPKEGECYDGRSADLRIGIKNFKPGTSGTVKSEAMEFCLVFIDGKMDSFRCASGTVELAFDAKTNEYRGKYDLRLNDDDLRKAKLRVESGARRGDFRAGYCKPKAPAKKK